MRCISPRRVQAFDLLAGKIETQLIVILSDIDMPGMDGPLEGRIYQFNR
jgi:hypothetical protein